MRNERWIDSVCVRMLIFFMIFLVSFFVCIGLFGWRNAIFAMVRAFAIAGWILALISFISATIDLKKLIFLKDLRNSGNSAFRGRAGGLALRRNLLNDEGLYVRNKMVASLSIFLCAVIATAGAGIVASNLIIKK